jgi:hypothetical protein
MAINRANLIIQRDDDHSRRSRRPLNYWRQENGLLSRTRQEAP